MIESSVAWGDSLEYDHWVMEVASTIPLSEVVVSSDSEGEWETVGAKSVSTAEHHTHAPKWCRNGNACQWKNCKFRHERCEHHDRWVASRGKTRGCRCLTSDPDSCLSPEDGGCKYDHRDISSLEMYVEKVKIVSEDELLTIFMPKGMDCRASDFYDITQMSKNDKGLLLRSLEATAKSVLSYDLDGGIVNVVFH